MPRRKKGELVDLEIEILQIATTLSPSRSAPFHGFGLAQAMGESGSGRLIGHGTIYKALARLEDMGLLTSRWERDPPDDRPRRRLYELTAEGARAAARTQPAATTVEPSTRPGLAPGTA